MRRQMCLLLPLSRQVSLLHTEARFQLDEINRRCLVASQSLTMPGAASLIAKLSTTLFISFFGLTIRSVNPRAEREIPLTLHCAEPSLLP